MLTPDRTGIEITISINEGPRYRIRTLTRLRARRRRPRGRAARRAPRAARDGPRQARRLVQPRRAGEGSSARSRRSTATPATPTSRRRPTTQLDPDRREVDIVVAIRRNQLVYFGRIEIRGNTKTRDKVIRRELEIEERELFSETKLERSKRRITALGYFERVDISTEQGDDPEHINVNVEIGEKPTGTFQIGAGFSSIENFIATAQVQQANLLRQRPVARRSRRRSPARGSLIDLRFFEPYLFDSSFSASVSVYDQLRTYNEFSQTSHRRLAHRSATRSSSPSCARQLTYTLENDEISTSTTSTVLGTASRRERRSSGCRSPTSSTPGITSSIRPALTFDTRNNQLFPTSGIYLQGSVELASTARSAARTSSCGTARTGQLLLPDHRQPWSSS